MLGRGDEEEIIVPTQAPPNGTNVRHGAGENGYTSMNIFSTGCLFVMSILFICGSSFYHPENLKEVTPENLKDVISYYSYDGGDGDNGGLIDDDTLFGTLPLFEPRVPYPGAFFTAGTVFFAAFFVSTALLAKETISPVAIGFTALALVGDSLWFVASIMAFNFSFGSITSYIALWLSGSILISVYFVFDLNESYTSPSRSITKAKALALASASLATVLIGIGFMIVLFNLITDPPLLYNSTKTQIELFISGSVFYLVSALLMAASIFTAK